MPNVLRDWKVLKPALQTIIPLVREVIPQLNRTRICSQLDTWQSKFVGQGAV